MNWKSHSTESVPKNGISGEKPLLRDVKRTLKAYLEVRQPTGEGLFVGREGSLGYKRISQLFKGYAKKAMKSLFGFS